MSKENVEVIKRNLEAQARGDIAAMLEDMTDDVVIDASRRVLDPISATEFDARSKRYGIENCGGGDR